MTTGTPPVPRRLVLLTGLSGAGKTTALKVLEDLGFETIDNLPLWMLESLIFAESAPVSGVAVAVDARTRDFTTEGFLGLLERLERAENLDCQVLFLDCGTRELERRYKETRHIHPLAKDRPLEDGIRMEREWMEPIRLRAGQVVDTTGIGVAQLGAIIRGHFTRPGSAGPVLFLNSFGFRAGVPRQADLVMDVRFLRNPHYEAELKPLTGRDPRVVNFIVTDADFEPFMDRFWDLLTWLLPRFRGEGKSYLTIAVGCTGGRHRSVCVAEELARRMRAAGWPVHLKHRELGIDDDDH